MSETTRETFRGSAAVACAAVLWGTWRLWLVGPALDAGAQSGFVLTIAGAIATAIALWSRRPWREVPRRAWLLLLAFGVAEAINTGLYFHALSAGDTASAAVTHYLAPIMIAVFSPLLGEATGRRTIPAAAVASVAMMLLVGLGATSAGSRVAILAGSGSAVFYAAGVFLSKRATRIFRPWEIVGFHDLIAGPLVALTSRTPLTSASPKELSLLLVGTLIPGTIAAAIYMYGLARISPARAGVLAYLEPVGAAIVGAAVVGEAMTSIKALAMLVIVGAGIAVIMEPPRKNAASVAAAG